MKAPKIDVRFYPDHAVVHIDGHRAKLLNRSCRSVYRYKGWVVKVAVHAQEDDLNARSSAAHCQNRREINNWNKSKGKTYRRFLVPIVKYSPDYRWLCMPYIEDVSNTVSEILRKALKLNDHEYQMAITKSGRVLCYDYGL